MNQAYQVVVSLDAMLHCAILSAGSGCSSVDGNIVVDGGGPIEAVGSY